MRKADKEPLDYFTRTIAYFTEEFRINTQIDRPGIQADPLDFMARWVQAFKWPLVFLLSAGDWKPRGYALGVSFLNEGRFLLEARGIIFNLMTLPHTEWRAPVLFVLHMLRGRTKPGAALVAFLKQLECLGVYLELCKYPGIKINGKGLTNKRVYNHLIRELFKFNADCAAAPAQITDDQLGGIVRRLWSDEPGSGGDHVGVLRRPQSLVSSAYGHASQLPNLSPCVLC